MIKQEIYKNYADNIKTLLAKGEKRGSKVKSFSAGIEESRHAIKLANEAKDISLFNSLSQFNILSGKKTRYNEKTGLHPDFANIKQSDLYENHYITSMFIDIKNSTGLFRKYEPYWVAQITTAVQKVALHTCWYFDGYIQRFHGDGLLVYFGGKNIPIEKSVENALNAASFFSYFMQNDLKEIFAEQEVDRLFTRIGIDVGYDDDVVWHLAGMKECSEVTTCSLHTSLAAKMQNNACNNGIMLGDHVKKETSLNSNLFSIIHDKDGKELRYIFQIPQENFYYTQWDFNWKNHLKNNPIVYEAEDEKLYFKPSDSKVEDINTNFLKNNTSGYRPYFKG